MKKVLFFIILITSFAFVSCRNKTVVLLTKKWDCVQVENILPPNGKYASFEDSVNTTLIHSALQSLNWTFKNNMGYECSLGSRVVLQGKYQLMDDDKVIILTPESSSSGNRYVINSLTEYELVLSGRAENKNLVLHFRSSD